MEAFTVGMGRGYWARLVGRNPLVRGTDRVEAWMYLLAVLIVLIATPVAGAVGTSVHETRSRLYVEEARNHYQVEATAVEDGYMKVASADLRFFAHTEWSVSGRDHAEDVEWSESPKAGDKMSIWVDADGSKVSSVSPQSRAGMEAVGMAMSVWYGVVIVVALLVYLTRRRIDHQRYADWEHEISSSSSQP